MKFGLTFPYNRARQVVAWAELAEKAGWDGIFLGDAIWTEDPLVILAAAAMKTSRIRLGTMVVPVPLRRPWKLSSESLAVDQLSEGRLILGLGAGAVWMGWYGFPDEETGTKSRVEMLDETVEILKLLYRREPFDYAGTHYHLQLTQLPVEYYPPKPVQQPHIPIWIPAILPHQSSLQRILKCDGVIPEKRDAAGQPAPLTPEDIRDIRAFVDEHRGAAAPFEIVLNARIGDLEAPLSKWQEAGATWIVEELISASDAEVTARIEQGPPEVY